MRRDWRRGLFAKSSATKSSATGRFPPDSRLNSGALMPLVGFGTAGLGEATERAVLWALETGYRSIDSAQAREWYREDLVEERGGAERRLARGAVSHLEAAPAAPGLRRNNAAVPGVAG